MAPLQEYRRKRRFQDTPEPAGQAPPKGGRRFVVQKHAARRLHYDFRLEMDGALKSWAVPKGPSLDPSDKRLAVETEDHPLEYADFEGTIPAGNYGAGTVMVWDRGSFECEGEPDAAKQYARGELKFRLFGEKLRGSFALVRLRHSNEKNAWLLIKHRDDAADQHWNIDKHDGSALTGRTMDQITGGEPSQRDAAPSGPAELDDARRAPMPDGVQPMLATLVEQPFSDPKWLFEIKWDGERALARIDEGRLELRSRAGRVITAQYPELAVLPQAVRARQAVLDGEILVLDQAGRSDFGRLQRRMNVEKPAPALIREFPALYAAFDLLYCDGYDLRPSPLLERKRLLREILDAGSVVRYSDHQEKLGRELFALARESGLEGIVGKRIDSPYVGGRSPHWIKVKSTEELDAVIGGWTDPRAGRRYFGSLLLGLYEGKALRFIGHVGTGFSGAVLKQISEALGTVATGRSPFHEPVKTNEPAHWAEPKLIARVRYAGWTEPGRLRAPAFLGIRSDIDPAECRFETAKPAQAVRADPPTKNNDRVLRGSEALERELERGHEDTIMAKLDGKRLRLTHLSKPLFPAGITKRQLLAYYFRIADRLLPFLRERPLVLRRFPNGVTGKSFFQKEAGEAVPEWMETVPIASEDVGREVNYFIANDLAALLFLVNLGSIDQNPFASRREDLEHPDYLIFDLDPTEGVKFSEIVRLMKALAQKLGELGLAWFVKTSGATGMHLYVPLEPRYSYTQVRTFAEIVARLLAAGEPGLVTLQHSLAKRPKGRIYVDVFRNASGQVIAAPYTVRPVPNATVSTPLSPNDLRPSLDPRRFTLKTVIPYLEKKDPWAGFWKRRQRLEEASEKLERLAGRRGNSPKA